MITIEVRKDGRMIGFVEQDPKSADDWRWVAIEGRLQSRGGFPNCEEALTDLLDAVGEGV